MSETESTREQREGFELKYGEDSVFYEWSVTSRGKDLQLMDRLTGGMLPQEFFACLADDNERQRGPILMTLIATSIRARHPEWSVNRIERQVMGLDLDVDVEFIGGDDDEAPVEGVAKTVPPSEPSGDGEATPESSAKSKESPASESETPSENPA